MAPLGQDDRRLTVHWDDPYNPTGSVHGGVLSTLLDSALSCAVHSTLAAGTGSTTAEARLTDAAGKLYAHAVGTCLVFTAR